jgi:hypothetical protein
MFENSAALKDFGYLQSTVEAEKAVFMYETIRCSSSRCVSEQMIAQTDWASYTADELDIIAPRKKQHALCAPCTGETFLVTQKAGIILRNHQGDLLAMKYTRDEIDRLLTEQRQFERFEWTICSSCPPGFVRGAWSVAKDSTHSGAIIEHAGLMIPCKACTVEAGVQIINDKKNGVCQRCGTGSYQVASEVVFSPYSRMPNGWDGNPSKVVVSFSCRKCPAGFFTTASLLQCRGASDADCCTACPVNQYKPAEASECAAAGKNMVVMSGAHFVESAGTSRRPCGIGEMLVVCYDGHCVQQPMNAWKTCVPCSVDQTTRSSDKSGCTACSLENRHLVDPTDSTKCTTCGSCDELFTEPSEQQLKSLPGFETLTNVYAVSSVSASCRQLQRRQLQKDGDVLRITGSDHWRDLTESKGKQLPPWHFLDRQAGSICVKKHCMQACKGRFEYSDGCGTSITPANTWVSHGVITRKLDGLLAREVSNANDWNVLGNGKCHFCTPCEAGHYNAGCNKNYELGAPHGECKQCRKDCPPGNFMRHPDRDAGCHDPPLNQNATDAPGRFQILHDYTCVPCPRWVLQDTKIYVVSACGKHKPGDTYTHFSSDVKSNVVQAEEKPVVEESNANEEIAGVQRRNFRTFINNLRPYCPSSFFFKSTIPGCGFLERGDTFELPDNARVKVGYDEYNARCCQPCTTCDTTTQRKDMSSWQLCTGSSIEDLQNKCVDKCVLGYWEDKDTGQCNRCSTCFEGVLKTS